ncbi:anti-sigma factor domain-containing protein [Sphingobacterium corticis]|uniref:Anti-sigma factor domain-containing protein n=1 Tax=Sphingobacterium corticis TaxID=1812823 RepID=A0ABW5NN72_9SPHI
MDIKEYISSGIVELYVLGVATEEEASILECVRNKHPEVEQAIREAEQLMEDTATIQSIAPPIDLRDSIWASLESTVAESETPSEIFKENNSAKTETAFPKNEPIRIVSLRPFAIAATALLVGSVAANIYFYQRNQTSEQEIIALQNKNQSSELLLSDAYRNLDMFQNPAVSRIALAGVETHPEASAMVLWNKDDNSVYLVAENLPEVPKGKQYQLWALLDGQPIDAGVIPLNGAGETHSMKPINNAQAFAITLEDEGGKPTPNLSELHVIGEI